MPRARFSDIIHHTGEYLSSGKVVTPGDYMNEGSLNTLCLDGGPGESFGGFGAATSSTAQRFTTAFLETTAGLGDVSSAVRLTGNVLTFTSGSKTVTASSAQFTSADLYKLVLSSPSTAFPLSASAYITKVVSTTQVEISVAAAASGTTVRMYVFEPSPRGSVVPYVGRSCFFCGDTLPVYVGGTSLGLNASTTLQFKLYSGGSYGTTRTAGLVAPSMPTVTVTAGGGTKLRAVTYSAIVTRIRPSTGAESNGSPQSVTVTPTAVDRIRVALNDDVTNGQTSWGVYLTNGGEGDDGQHFMYAEVADSALSGAAPNKYIDLEFRDSDLQAKTPPVDHNPPPVAPFFAILADCGAMIGAWGDGTSTATAAAPGSLCHVSKRGYIEAYPADFNHLLALPEPPVATMTRPGENAIYVWGRNSLSRLVPEERDLLACPLRLETLWSTTGVFHPHSACFADGELFAYTGQLGLVRMGADGRPDSSFAEPVRRDLKAFSPGATVVDYDPGTQVLTVASGSKVLNFCKASGKWGAPLRMTVSATDYAVVGAYVTDGGLRLVAADTSALYAFPFAAGTGGSSWVVRSNWRDGGHPQVSKTITQPLRVALDMNGVTADVTLKVYTNLNPDSAVYTKTFTPAGGGQHVATYKPNLKGAKSYCVELSGTGAGVRVNEVELWGTANYVSV